MAGPAYRTSVRQRNAVATCFGRGGKGGKRGRGTTKTPVIIEASTHGNAVGFTRMHVVEHVDKATIGKLLSRDAAGGQTIKSDGGRAFGVVTQHGHQHNRHIASGAKATEVLPWVHTLASKAKAFLLGTFQGIDRKPVQGYIDEFCDRFSCRFW